MNRIIFLLTHRFFSVFDFKLIKGNVSDPFPDDNSVVITETMAKKYFGNDDPMGKVIVQMIK